MDEKAFKRFAAKLQVDTEKGCLLWTGATNNAGYGFMSAAGRVLSAHRLAYEHWVGPVPAGLVLDHLCRVRRCCAPDHLEAVTQSVNLRRGHMLCGAANPSGRKTHCPQGHAYSEENTYHNAGRRHCRQCQRKRGRESYRRKHAGRKAATQD